MEVQKIISGKNSFDKFIKSFGNKKLSGYIWMVEGLEPVVYNKEQNNFEKINKTVHSFNKIQEAYLTDGTYSIHIKNIDGIEHVFVFSEGDFKDDKLFKIDEIKSYPSHIKDIDTIHFKQVYKLTASVSDDEFRTWQPLVKLFKGLNLNKN